MPLLTAIRQAMSELNCDYYLVGSSDSHQNEYVPDCWQRRAVVSGFTGSAGDALIGKNGAWLWTDSRYFLQAEKELSTDWQLMKQGFDLPMTDWLQKITPCRVGVDPSTLSAKQAKALTAVCELVAIDRHLVDAHTSMPAQPNAATLPYPDSIAGESVESKLLRIRSAMKDKQADYLLVSALDECAWLTNTRGNDIDYNPLTIAYAIIGLNTLAVFLNSPTNSDIEHHWQKNKIISHPYDSYYDALALLSGTIWCDPQSNSWRAKECLANKTLIEESSPIPHMKALKNTTELAGITRAHEADALALVRFFHWLNKHWTEGITECSAAKHLAKYRLFHTSCRDLSFPSISAFAEHGAVIHYNPSEATDKRITDQAIYLLDSGGQYWEGGTTDVTRCVHLGEPTAEEKYHYTLVLKAHLALRHAVFAEGTTGYALDCVTRQTLWEAGYDFGHGTGHGVGAYLCVHEGPQGISPRANPTPLEVGMIITNEPGLYLEGKYGIRIENVMKVIVKHNKNPNTGLNKPILAFDDLTLVPYDKGLIDTSLLNDKERQRIDEYHQRIWHCLSNKLSDDPDVYDWLKESTSPLAIGDQR